MDIRDGQRVKVKKCAAHTSPIFVEGQRARSEGDDPFEIKHDEAHMITWSGYYHQLRSEGAIEVLAEPPVKPVEPKQPPKPVESEKSK